MTNDITPQHVCRYCHTTLAEHTNSGIDDTWKMCPDKKRIVCVTAQNFRPPGHTVKCERCGHEQMLPENIARHLGAK